MNPSSRQMDLTSENNGGRILNVHYYSIVYFELAYQFYIYIVRYVSEHEVEIVIQCVK